MKLSACLASIDLSSGETAWRIARESAISRPSRHRSRCSSGSPPTRRKRDRRRRRPREASRTADTRTPRSRPRPRPPGRGRAPTGRPSNSAHASSTTNNLPSVYGHSCWSSRKRWTDESNRWSPPDRCPEIDPEGRRAGHQPA